MGRSQVSGCVITEPAVWLPAVWNTICMFRISSLSASSLCCSPRWVITIKETLLWRRRLPDSRSLPAIPAFFLLCSLLLFPCRTASSLVCARASGVSGWLLWTVEKFGRWEKQEGRERVLEKKTLLWSVFAYAKFLTFGLSPSFSHLLRQKLSLFICVCVIRPRLFSSTDDVVNYLLLLGG